MHDTAKNIRFDFTCGRCWAEFFKESWLHFLALLTLIVIIVAFACWTPSFPAPEQPKVEELPRQQQTIPGGDTRYRGDHTDRAPAK